MTTAATPAMDAIRREEFFQRLREAAWRLAQRYVVFLVDHGRSSRSTHKFWWNHFEEACQVLEIPCRRVQKASDRWPQDHRREGKRGIYLFFTMQSLYRDRFRWLRALHRDAIRVEDIVASWDPQVVEAFHDCEAFRIGFRGEDWLAAHGPTDRERVVVWEPYAPLTAVEAGMKRGADGRAFWDFTYFGTLNPHNYDQFRRILQPLAARHRCRYAGKLWRVSSLVPLRYGFRPFLLDEDRGLEILFGGRINLVLHNDYHRRTRTLTERLFMSVALGRPVVCDNSGAWQYFTAEEIPVGENPQAFLALCEDALHHLEARRAMARELQQKVRRHYTYLHTVVQFLQDIDSKVAGSG